MSAHAASAHPSTADTRPSAAGAHPHVQPAAANTPPPASACDPSSALSFTPEQGSLRLLRRWPSLPLLSLSFWVAWRFTALSGTLPMDLSGNSPVFFATMIVVCACAALMPERFRTLIDSPRSIVALGAAGALGTALLIAAATLSPESGARLVLCGAGSLLCGVGITCVALRSCELLGRLTPTNIWIWLAYTEFLVVGIYFTMATAPAAIGAVGLSALPLLAGWLLSFSAHPSPYFASDNDEHERKDVPTHLFVKFFLLVLMLSLTACFAKMITLQQIPVDSLEHGIAWPALERIGIAICIVAGVVYFSKRFPFSKMCMFVVVTIIALLGLFMLSFPNSTALFFMSTLVHSTLECITLAFSACLIFKTTSNPLFIGGIALATLYGGSLVGDVLKAVSGFVPIDQSTISMAFIATSVLCVASALVFFRERAYDDLLGSVEDFFPTPPSAASASRDQLSAAAVEKLKGTWGLSSRECEIAAKLQSGNTVARIAENMSLSVHTVRGYVQSIYAKCGVHSRNELLDLLKKLD